MGACPGLPFISFLLILPGPGVRPGGQGTGEGQSLCGQENSRALRGSPCGDTLGWRAPRSRRGAEFLCQSPKARRVGWGRPFVWQLRRGGFGPQDAGLFTVGSPGPSKPPCGTGRLFTQQGKKELRPGPGLLPAQNEEGRSISRPAASWGSDGNFILPCVPSFIQWIAEV